MVLKTLINRGVHYQHELVSLISEPSTVLYRCHRKGPLEPLFDSRLQPHLLLTGGGLDDAILDKKKLEKKNADSAGWLMNLDDSFFCRFEESETCCFVKLCLLIVECWWWRWQHHDRPAANDPVQVGAVGEERIH